MNKIILLLLFGLLCCKQKAEKLDQSPPHGSDSSEVTNSRNQFAAPIEYQPLKALDSGKVESDLKDTTQFYLLKGPCAVTEWPDTTWLRHYRESMPEESWNEIISDNQYYESLAIDTLELKGVKVFSRLSWKKRYLKFQRDDNSVFIFDKTKSKTSWGIILFNGHDDPMIWSDSFLGSNFKKVFKDRK